MYITNKENTIWRKGDTGLTAFQNACIKGDSDLVQTFIKNADEFNFDLNTKDGKGWTAFHYACVWGHSDLVKNVRIDYFYPKSKLFVSISQKRF